jgi:hypothetical protein
LAALELKIHPTLIPQNGFYRTTETWLSEQTRSITPKPAQPNSLAAPKQEKTMRLKIRFVEPLDLHPATFSLEKSRRKRGLDLCKEERRPQDQERDADTESKTSTESKAFNSFEHRKMLQT